MARRGFYGGGAAVEIHDFTEEPLIIEERSPFTNTSASADLNQLGGTTTVARAYFRVPRAGIITDIGFYAEDGITQHATNKYTFTGLNLQTAGDGNRAVLDTTAHVNTTDTDATALNSGSNLTAKVFYSFSLSGTAANLYAKEGDVLEITATGSSSAAVVDAAHCRLKIRALPSGLKPTVVHTGGATTNVPIAIQKLSSIGGEALLQLSATSEAQIVRLDKADQLLIDPTALPMFSCRLKVSGAAAVTRMVWGLASAYTATLDNTTCNAWFKLDGNSLVMVTETDDNTTDTDDQVTGVTLVADTYYTFSINFDPDTSHIKFSVDGTQCTTVHAGAAFANTQLLQPFIAIQKDSGTGAQSITVDWVEWDYARY